MAVDSCLDDSTGLVIHRIGEVDLDALDRCTGEADDGVHDGPGELHGQLVRHGVGDRRRRTQLLRREDFRVLSQLDDQRARCRQMAGRQDGVLAVRADRVDGVEVAQNEGEHLDSDRKRRQHGDRVHGREPYDRQDRRFEGRLVVREVGGPKELRAERR